MDQLFGDQNDTLDEWFDSIDENHNNDSYDQMDSSCGQMKTTIEKVLDVSDVSPIRKTTKCDISFESVYDLESDMSFNTTKNSRKYFSAKKSFEFSPILRSTPKPSKTRLRRRDTNRKKSHKRITSLWDKAIVKNPELKDWINSFNEDMKKVESSELSVTQSSISANDLSNH